MTVRGVLDRARDLPGNQTLQRLDHAARNDALARERFARDRVLRREPSGLNAIEPIPGDSGIQITLEIDPELAILSDLVLRVHQTCTVWRGEFRL